MDHDKSSLALMAQMTPAIVKKMATLFQVTFAEPPLAINCLEHCYIFKGTLTCIESLTEMFSPEREPAHRANFNLPQLTQEAPIISL
jgi:hypothetical protein